MQYIRHNCTNIMLFHRMIITDEHGFIHNKQWFYRNCFPNVNFRGKYSKTQKVKYRLRRAEFLAWMTAKQELYVRGMHGEGKERIIDDSYLRPGEIVKESFFVTSRCYLCPFWLRGEKDRGAEFFEIHLSKWNDSIDYGVIWIGWIMGQWGPSRPWSTLCGIRDPQATSAPHPFLTSRIFAYIYPFPKKQI